MENNENMVTPEAEVTQTPQQPAQKQSFTDSVKGFTQKMDLEGKAKKAMETGTDLFNKAKALPKQMLLAIGGGVAALVVLIIVLLALSNTKSTPLSNVMKVANAKKFDTVLSKAPDIMNGFCESEIRNIIKIAKKSDLYKDNKEDIDDAFAEYVDGMKENFGDNYKISYKITDKEKMDKDDCEDIQDSMKEMGKLITKAAKEVNKLDDDIWEELEDQTGLKEKELKNIVKEVESIGNKMKKAKVTAGYELEVTVIIKGSELEDEPIEEEMTINVIKVNGRWIIDFVSPVASLVGQLGNMNIGSLIGMAGMGASVGGGYYDFY